MHSNSIVDSGYNATGGRVGIIKNVCPNVLLSQNLKNKQNQPFSNETLALANYLIYNQKVSLESVSLITGAPIDWLKDYSPCSKIHE